MKEDPVLGEFSQRVVNATTIDAVRAALRDAIERYGYTASAGRATVVAGDGQRNSTVMFRNWTPDWAAISDGNGFPANSYVLAEAQRRATPFTWQDAIDARPLTKAEQLVWETALSWGWRNGFVVPFHGPGYFATISMGSTERDLDLDPPRRLEMQMIATLTHERCHALAKPDIPLAAPLSARELECLRWVAAGKTDWEISKILSISSTTVKFHLNQSRKKLGASSRAQAVAQLFLRGLYY